MEDVDSMINSIKRDAKENLEQLKVLRSFIEKLIQQHLSLREEAFDLRSGEYLARVIDERDRYRKALEFYTCNDANCECAPGNERHGDLSCGYVARNALESTNEPT